MCKKKSYNEKYQAKGALKVILKESGKKPWRDEITVYQCEECNLWHISSILENGDYIPDIIKEKGYFEYQKEKWGNWLHNFSSAGAVINKRNKKYGT